MNVNEFIMELGSVVSGIQEEVQIKAEEDADLGANVAGVVVDACNNGGLVDAVHDVDLQGVQVGQDLIALGTGVFGNIPLMLPVSTSSNQSSTSSVWISPHMSLLHLV